ncbi:hypothetical protein BJ912DRAFT_1142595 [Pholiota molesta]|nr:hypothetical protein BJ912DRAFT_1142595 [Pholiota molesta]
MASGTRRRVISGEVGADDKGLESLRAVHTDDDDDAMKTPLLFTLLASLLLGVLADAAGDIAFNDDPYLKYRPEFARSLPIQIMLTGVVLTLVAVLLIHLMFTAQYHWPLAPVNYVLQLSGVTTLLISLIATIHVVLSATFAESEKWPYMLSYIAVNVPPLDLESDTESWSIAERATWLVMNASTSGLIQITHIQFLTLLYPSRLEGRLIFALLGPLAIVAAVMQLLPISNHQSVNQVASAVRNVCNATLSLLFTLALFIWGLLVNRKQAWRTDGGTAVFGCAALSLAVISTALNFLYVHKEEEFVWLPPLMWAVVLWQSFLGWWWWVGAGSGRARSGREGSGRQGAAEGDENEGAEDVEGRRRRLRAQHPRRLAPERPLPHPVPAPLSASDRLPLPPTNADETASQLSRASSVTVTGSATQQTHTTLQFLRACSRASCTSRRARAAHARDGAPAARGWAGGGGAAPRGVRRSLAGGEGEREVPSVVGWGWGWHGFGWRRRAVEDGGRRRRMFGEEPEPESESWPTEEWRGFRDEPEYEMRRARRPRRRRREKDDDDDDIYVADAERQRDGPAAEHERPESSDQPRRPERRVDTTPNSVWWWGPLKKWRLKDSTTY